MVSEGDAGQVIKMDHRQSLLNLKTKIIAVNQVTVRYKDLLMKAEASKKEIESLKNQLKTVDPSRDQLKKEVESLKAELDRRDNKIKDTNKQLVNFRNQNETLEQQVRNLEDTVGKQKEKMTNLQRLKAALNAKNKELEVAVAEKRKDEEIEKFSLENEISNLKEQLSQLNNLQTQVNPVLQPSTNEISVQTDAPEAGKQSPVPVKKTSTVILPKKAKTCDKSVMTERPPIPVDDAYPLHCSKCSITLEKPMESIINTMTSMPPLLPQMPATPRQIPRAPPAPPVPTVNSEVSTTIEKLQVRLNHLERREKKRKNRLNSMTNWNPPHPMHCCNHSTTAPQNITPTNMMTTFFEKMMNFADKRQPKRPGKHVTIRKKRLKQRKIKTKVRQHNWEIESVMTASNDRDSAIDMHLLMSPMAQNSLMDDSNFSDGLNSQMEVDEPFCDAIRSPGSSGNYREPSEISDILRPSSEPVIAPYNPAPAVTASAGPKKRGRKPKKPVETSTQDTLLEEAMPNTPARRGRKPLRPLSRESSPEIGTPSQRRRTLSETSHTPSQEASPETALSRSPVRSDEKPSNSVEQTQAWMPKKTHSGSKCIITKEEVFMRKMRIVKKDTTTVGPKRFEESLSEQEENENFPGQKRRISHLATDTENIDDTAVDDLTSKRRRVTRSMTKTDEERKTAHREIAKTIVIPAPAVEKPRKLTILRKNPPSRIPYTEIGVEAEPSSSEQAANLLSSQSGAPLSPNNTLEVPVTAELPNNNEDKDLTRNTSSSFVPVQLLRLLIDKKVAASPQVCGNSIESVSEKVEKTETLNGSLNNYSFAGKIQFQKSDTIPGSCPTIPKSLVEKKQPDISSINVEPLKTTGVDTPSDTALSSQTPVKNPVKQQANVLESQKINSKASELVEKLRLPTLEDFTRKLMEIKSNNAKKVSEQSPKALEEVKTISEDSSKEKTAIQVSTVPADRMEVTLDVFSTVKSSTISFSPGKIENAAVKLTLNLDKAIVNSDPKNLEKLDQNQLTESSSKDENLPPDTNKSFPDEVTPQKVEKLCCDDINPEKMEIEEAKIILNDNKKITKDMSVLDIESPASPDAMEVPEEPRDVAPVTSIYDQAVIAEDSAFPTAESTLPTLPTATPVVNAPSNNLPACAALPIKQFNTCLPVVRQLRNRKVSLNAPAPPARPPAKSNKVVWPQDNSIASMLHHHLTTTNVKCSQNHVKYRQAAAAKKYQDSKNAIKRELHRLLGPQEWSNHLHESVVQNLAKFPSTRAIVQGILAAVTDCSDSEEPIIKEFTPPAPMMTESEQKIVTLLHSLESHHPNIISFTFSLINFQLFRTITNSSSEVILSFARVFIALSRMKKDRERVRMFICDAIYHLSNRSYIVLHVALSNWPEVLSIYDSTQPQHLQMCIATIIRSYKFFDNNKSQIMQMRNLLRVYYKYPDDMPQPIEQIRKLLAMFVEGKHDMTVTTTILLLAKKEGVDWTYKNIVSGELMQIIVKNQNSTGTYDALRLLGFLLRVFPVRDENGLVGKVVEPLREILDSGAADVEVQEGVVSALLSLSRHKFQDITKSILTWKPTRALPPRLHDQLQIFFNSRSFGQWSTIRQKISSSSV